MRMISDLEVFFHPRFSKIRQARTNACIFFFGIQKGNQADDLKPRSVLPFEGPAGYVKPDRMPNFYQSLLGRFALD